MNKDKCKYKYKYKSMVTAELVYHSRLKNMKRTLKSLKKTRRIFKSLQKKRKIFKSFRLWAVWKDQRGVEAALITIPIQFPHLRWKILKTKGERIAAYLNKFLALSPRLVHFKVLVSNLNEFLRNICCRLHSTIRKDGASQGRGEQNAKNEWKLSSEFRYFFKNELEPGQQISRLDLK